MVEPDRHREHGVHRRMDGVEVLLGALALLGLTEETTRLRRLEKSRRDCLAAYWLASAPVGSTNHRRRSYLMSWVEQHIPLFAEFLAWICKHVVCNPDADGETMHRYCGSVRRREDGLVLVDDFAWASERSPTPRVRRGVGRHTDLFPPRPCIGAKGGGA